MEGCDCARCEAFDRGEAFDQGTTLSAWEHLHFRVWCFHGLAVSPPSGAPIAFTPFILTDDWY